MNWKEEKRNGIKSHPKGKEIIVVSSGAVGIGKNVLGISEKPAGSVKQAYIIEENQKDIMLARKNKMTEPLIDRLLLNENRIRKMAEEALPVICDRLSVKGVEIRGDEAARQIDERIAWAQESDRWDRKPLPRKSMWSLEMDKFADKKIDRKKSPFYNLNGTKVKEFCFYF